MSISWLIFFAIITAAIALMHTVLYRRLVRPSRMSERGRRFVNRLLWSASLAIVAAFLLGRWLPDGPWSRLLNWLGFTAMGVYAVLFPLTLLRDLLLVGPAIRARLARKRAAQDEAAAADAISRRTFLERTTGMLVLAGGLGVSIAGFLRAVATPVVHRQPVVIAGLPEALDGFTIAQISDLHVGPTLRRAWLEDVVARTNALDADVIAVTGDMIDGRVDDLREVIAPLGDLRARHGVYVVTGNHEYYWGAEAWVAELRRLGLDVLVNEHRTIPVGASTLLLAGVTDLRAHDILPAHATDPAGARKGAPETDVSVLLAHQPKSLYAAKAAGYDLQLSGHTHGGQFFPYNFLIHFFHPAVAGLYRFDDLQVYVNRGTGYWGPPLRSTAEAEITLIELQRPA